MFSGSRLPREGRALGKVEISIPLVTWRDGRPRFFASKVHRDLGYKGEDLRHGKDGAWFTLDEAIEWSRTRQLDLAQKRAAIAGGQTTARKTANAARRTAGLVTVSQVVEALFQIPRMNGKEVVEGKKKRAPLSKSTVRYYRSGRNLLEKFDGGVVWHEPAADLTGPVLDKLLDEIEIANGLDMARSVRALVAAAFRNGRMAKVVRHNPTHDMETTLPIPEPRVRPASVIEIVTLIDVADALGFPDFGDMVAAGVWLGQRKNDRLAVSEGAVNGDGVLFSPSKKKKAGERLLIPLSAVMRQRRAAARARRRDWKVKPIAMFPRDATGRAWVPDWYDKVFRAVRHVAAFGELARDEKGALTRDAHLVFGKKRDVAGEIAAAGIAPLASIADLRDQDLRDTCFSWLAWAGASKFQIAGFSGHAFGRDDRILKHYVSIPPSFAREGLALLEAWYAAQLAAIEGQRMEAGM